MIKKAIYLLLVIVLIGLSSCGKYSKLLKSADSNKKYEAAIKYYDSHDYYHALQLFDDVIPVYRGKEQAEKIHYYYAYCYYGQSDWIMASYHFKNFVKIFPNSKNAEECLYMSAYSKFLDSPPHSLDQSSTYDAIKELQLFINFYPQSPRVEEANKLIDELRKKLILKAYEIAKMYYKMEAYSSAQIAFQNVLKDYPETIYKEEILYLILKSDFYYAKNSIESKKKERYQNVVKAYNDLVNNYPSTMHKSEADTILKDSQSELVNK